MRLSLPQLARHAALAAFSLGSLSSAACAAETGTPTRWVGTWATAPYAQTGNHTFESPTTLRQTVHVSTGGPSFRVTFTNEFGTSPLVLGSASVSLAAGPAVALAFAGQPTGTIAAGGYLVSDPVPLTLPALSDLTIDLNLPAQTVKTLTYHGAALTTGYEAKGKHLQATAPKDAKKLYNWRFLKAVEVATESPAAIVAFGDSITDGAQSTRDTNSRWPDELARRLQADPWLRKLGVLNEGIGGNRILHDVTGPSALTRFDRDVLSQPGVRYVLFLEGINDIGHAAHPEHPGDDVTATDVIAGMQQMIQQAHVRGLKIYGATLTPFAGSKYDSPAGEAMRLAVNDFIRSGAFDATIDFEKVVRDPAHPATMLPLYDSGDHLHPSDAGYKAMGDAIDLKLFQQ